MKKIRKGLNKLIPILSKIKTVSLSSLLKLKRDLTKRINTTSRAITQAVIAQNTKEFIELSEHKIKLLKDQKTVKKAITRKNFIFGINKLIFENEELTKNLDSLKEISQFRKMHPEFFRLLKKENNFVIESTITKIQEKLEKVEKKQTKVNNSFFTNSILILETI